MARTILGGIGIINLDSTRRSHTVPAGGNNSIVDVSRGFILMFSNESEQECKVEYSTYYLSSAGNELLSVATYEMQKDYFVDFAIEIKKKYNQKLRISLHVITALNDEECEYMEVDLIENC